MVNRYDYLSQIDVATFASRHLRLELEPWQKQAVCSTNPRGVLLTARQVGKTTVLAIRIVHHVLFHPGASVLVVSASEVQAGQVMAKVRQFLVLLGEATTKIKGRAWDLCLLATQGEIRALPCREAAMRGYTATLVVLDEAALVPDPVFHALLGTLGSTWDIAQVWIASTPRNAQGFFHDFVVRRRPGFLYLAITAEESGRVSPAFIALQRDLLPPALFAQEHECRFSESHDAAFRDDDISAALADRRAAIISPRTPPPALGRPEKSFFYLTNDLAQAHDYSSFCIIEHRPRYLGHHPESLVPLFHGELWVRWIQRFPLGSDYRDVLDFIRQATYYPEIQAAQSAEIVFDKGGGGAVYRDFLKAAQLGPRLIPIVITGGLESHETHGTFYVPKDELIKTTQFALRHRLLKIAPDCPGVPVLLDEMKHFRRLVTPGGHETYCGRAGYPDDVVMGLTFGVWRAFQRHKSALFRDLK